MIKYNSVTELKPFLENLKAVKLLSKNFIEIIHIKLDKGEMIDIHKNDLDVIFYVLSGKGKLTVENETVILKKDSFIEINKGLDRGWQNIGSSTLCLLAIKIMRN